MVLELGVCNRQGSVVMTSVGVARTSNQSRRGCAMTEKGSQITIRIAMALLITVRQI